MDDNQDLEEGQYDLDKTRIVVYKIRGELTKYRIGCNLKLPQRKIAVLSNTIARNHFSNTQPAIGIEKVIYMNTGEYFLSCNISLYKEGIQGPMNQRSDFLEAKQKCKILYDEHTEIHGEGNQTNHSCATSQATA